MGVTDNGKADAWRRRIDDQRAGGQSVRAWCKANDTHEHSFYWWRVRLGLSPAKPPAKRRQRPPLKPAAFARVLVHAPTAEPIRLRLAGRCELILPASMPLERVAKLVHALEGLPSGVEAVA